MKLKPSSNVGCDCSSTTRMMDRTAAFQLSSMNAISCVSSRYTRESLRNAARESISYYFASVIVLWFVASHRKTQLKSARPHLAFEHHTRVNLWVHLDPIVPWVVCREEAALRRWLERSAIWVGCDPVCFGVYHCAEECSELLRLGQEAAVMDKLRVRASVEVQRESGEDELGLLYRGAIEHWWGCRGEYRRNRERREIVPDVLG